MPSLVILNSFITTSIVQTHGNCDMKHKQLLCCFLYADQWYRKKPYIQPCEPVRWSCFHWVFHQLLSLSLTNQNSSFIWKLWHKHNQLFCCFLCRLVVQKQATLSAMWACHMAIHSLRIPSTIISFHNQNRSHTWKLWYETQSCIFDSYMQVSGTERSHVFSNVSLSDGHSFIAHVIACDAANLCTEQQTDQILVSVTNMLKLVEH